MTPTATAAPANLAQLHEDVDVHADAQAGPLQVTIEGVEFMLAPMRVAQVFPFLKHARPIFTALAQKPPSPPSALPLAGAGPGQGGGGFEAALADGDWLIGMLADHGEALVRALGSATGKSVEVLDELSVVGLVTLVKHVVQVNVDFFVAQGLSLPQNLLASSLGSGQNDASGELTQPAS